MPMVLAEETGDSMLSFVQSVFNAVTTHITLAQVATVIAAIIGAGIVAIFAWKFARKGFAFVRNALAGKSGRV